jgi:hypothetical protein
VFPFANPESVAVSVVPLIEPNTGDELDHGVVPLAVRLP